MKIVLKNQYVNIQYYLLCALMLFPILPRFAHSSIVIVLGTLTFFYLLIEGASFWNLKKSIQLVVLGIVFFLYLISAFYSFDYTITVRYLTKLIPVLVLPLVFLSSNKPILRKNRLLTLFVIYVFAVLLRLLSIHFVFWDELYDQKIAFWEFRNEIESFTDIHGTYLSMWMGVAILISVYLIKIHIKKIALVIIGVLVIVYIVYWQLIIGARMAFLAMLLSTLFMILRFLNISISRIMILFLVMSLLLGMLFREHVSSKIVELSNYESAIPSGKYEDMYPEISNEDIRSVIYYCAIKNIKEKPIIGFGIGDVDRQLQNCYDTEFDHTDTFQKFHFNTHSQYLLVIMATGFIGFFLYILSSLIVIKWSLTISELYTSFLLLLFLCSLFENILNRQDGVMLYSIFSAILFFSKTKNEL